MSLKSQDILFLLKLVSLDDRPWSYNELAGELFMSPSQVHASAKRSLKANLAIQSNSLIQVNTRNLTEFLVCCIRYVFVPERGSLNRGLPTLYAAPPLNKEFIQGNEPPPVWPDPEGKVRGESFSPLHKSAPNAAKADPKLYEMLVLVDAIRGGKVREREYAIKELKKRLDKYVSTKSES